MDYELYWVYSARELEEKFLSNPILTLARGGEYSEGKEVYIEIGKCNIQGKKLKMSTPSTRILTNFLIGGFALVYIIVILYQL